MSYVIHTRIGDDRQVMTLADFAEEDIEAIKRVQPSPEAAAFNYEMNE